MGQQFCQGLCRRKNDITKLRMLYHCSNMSIFSYARAITAIVMIWVSIYVIHLPEGWPTMLWESMPHHPKFPLVRDIQA